MQNNIPNERIKKKITEHFHGDVERFICLAALIVTAFFLYGIRVLAIVAVAFICALISDLLVRIVRSNAYVERDLSSYIIALTLILMFPASIGFDVVITSTFSAIMIGKYAFGGLHHYPFNPAAVGFTVAVASWPEQIFRYPVPFRELPLIPDETLTLISANSATLKNGGLPSTSTLDMLTGNFAGPMGATFIIIIVASGILLGFRRRISISIVLTFLLTFSALNLLFPRASDVNLLDLLRYELTSGMLLFACVFIISDLVVAPKRLPGRLIFGVVLAIIVVIFNNFGAFEIGICFSVIIAGALSGFFDKVSNIRLVRRWFRRRKELTDGK